MFKLGIDIGSTTLKCIVLDKDNAVIYKSYERHSGKIISKTLEIISSIPKVIKSNEPINFCLSGSAGMGIAESANIPFEQEVYSTKRAVEVLLPKTDVVIELGGEDAKILFLTNGLEARMNGSCAGGTGAFIDQMGVLMNISPAQMNELAKHSSKTYTVASRCGVFAKSDIQPLLNQGAKKEDISASIFAAVVNQTIAGLAQGRLIKGNIVYLGGPLTFLSELRASFDNILHVSGLCPDNSLYFVAIGAALSNQEPKSIDEIIQSLSSYKSSDNYNTCKPLFNNQAEYESFFKRHSKNSAVFGGLTATNKVYLGIDAGSTTIKGVIINDNNEIVKHIYIDNNGNAVNAVKDFMLDFYSAYPNARIVSSASTGYGEELIKNAFSFDMGIVETIAHYTAAKYFLPKVDFIIDIGGQDIKCFKIKNGIIDNVFLNEACSSGCGSFLQTFAAAWNYSIPEFARLGLFAPNPVDLGSRCTVFMNSNVKQAQKDGASIDNISAGLSISVIKNAMYKVIRAKDNESLGTHIVAQGGTFLNDAVLRCFEREIGCEVVRPAISELMGAFGAALYAKEHSQDTGFTKTLSKSDLDGFIHETAASSCSGCPNNCSLTINRFNNSRVYIGGNRCDKLIKNKNSNPPISLFDYKMELLSCYKPHSGQRGTIGIPMALNMFELYPFWHTFFTYLGFKVINSPSSNRALYLEGQHTIPSDTVCYPAKLIHGHIEALLKRKPDAIFYPCMSYNLDESLGDNHFNCPVVAYYPEVLAANIEPLNETRFIYNYLGLHRKADFTKRITNILNKEFGGFSKGMVSDAVSAAFAEYYKFIDLIFQKGNEYIALAEKTNTPLIILAGRPYHIDPEVNHGIDHAICELGAIVVTEDAYYKRGGRPKVDVLNQWSYHSRLYAAASAVAAEKNKNVNFIQLVSFGCGIDAITTDECKRIIEDSGKIYTQIKIDEITNIGAVKIRLRSLFAAIDLCTKGSGGN